MLAAFAVGMLLFGAAALLAVFCAELICARIEPFADGPPSMSPRPWLVVAVMALAGGFVALHGFAGSVLAVGTVVAFALSCFAAGIVARLRGQRGTPIADRKSVV